MCKRGISLAACGALALLLLAAEACPAQVVFFPVGRGGMAATTVGGRNFGYFPLNYGPTYYPSTTYSNPGSWRTTSNSFYMTAPTPLYYGAAYSPGYAPQARLVSPPPGVGLRTDSVTEAAYSAPVYPLQSPSYPSIYPVSPPLSAITERTAKVEVRVPADAEVWFEGQKTSQDGTDRIYSSPALESAQDYVYEIRARWNADGREVDQTRKVTVHAGDRVLVDFLSSGAK